MPFDEGPRKSRLGLKGGDSNLASLVIGSDYCGGLHCGMVTGNAMLTVEHFTILPRARLAREFHGNLAWERPALDLL